MNKQNEPSFRVLRETTTCNKSGKSWETFYVEQRKRFLWWFYWTTVQTSEMNYNHDKEYESFEAAKSEAERLNKGIPLYSSVREVVQ